MCRKVEDVEAADLSIGHFIVDEAATHSGEENGKEEAVDDADDATSEQRVRTTLLIASRQ